MILAYKHCTQGKKDTINIDTHIFPFAFKYNVLLFNLRKSGFFKRHQAKQPKNSSSTEVFRRNTGTLQTIVHFFNIWYSHKGRGNGNPKGNGQ